jgi:cobalt-zinc-cadmium efflux system outer membrane protein
MYSMRRVARYLTLLTFGVLSAAAPTWALEPEAVGEEPTGILTLARASAAALARSPALEGFSWELRASEARLLQAGLRPNPTLDAQLEDVAGTGQFSGTGQAQTTLLLSQLIELGGKRAARRDAAAAGRDLKGREYEVKRVEVLAQVAENFIELLAMQQQVALARETTLLAEASLRTVRERGRAGKAPAIEEKKALVALSRQRINEEHAEHELAVTRAQMAATWASITPSFDRADGALFHIVAVAPFEELATRLATGPELTRWTSEQQLRAAEARLANIRRIPNLTVGGGVRRFEGSDDSSFVFGFTLPLPVADRNQGHRAEAQARVHATAADGRAAAIRLHTVLFGIYQELRHAAQALGSLEREIVPLATSALTLAEQGFRNGRLSYLELLDAQRTFVDVRRERIEVAATYQQLLLGIERLLGAPVHSKRSTSVQESSEAPTSYQQLLLGMERRLAQPADSTSVAQNSTER